MSAVERPRTDFRERLLAGLAESIAEKGLQRTQIADIVRHARTSRRTFYECFADKESCFVELVEAANAAILNEMRVAVDPAAAWDEQVDQAIDSYLEAMSRNPALTVTVSRELPTLGARGAELLHDSIERYAELIVALVMGARPRAGGRATITIEESVMLAGGVAELIGRAVMRGDDLRTIGPTIKTVVKAVLDPARRRPSGR
jgi:AcrR family transcriptional regulator